MKAHLKDILTYSHHCNEQLITKFNDGDLHLAIPDNTLRLFSHILNAQRIWNSRIRKGKVDTDVWKVYEKEDLQEIENMNFQKSLEILEDLGPDDLIDYSNSKGEKFQNSIQEILFHIVNHSTYHRGQIAMELRKSGLEPVVSDYIFYKR